MTQQDSSEVPARSEIKVGQRVWAVEKRNYESGELTEGTVKRILTSKAYHPRGIKVMFEDGTVARVQRLTSPSSDLTLPKEEPPIDLDATGDLR